MSINVAPTFTPFFGRFGVSFKCDECGCHLSGHEYATYLRHPTTVRGGFFWQSVKPISCSQAGLYFYNPFYKMKLVPRSGNGKLV